jgi:hypothetical protein
MEKNSILPSLFELRVVAKESRLPSNHQIWTIVSKGDQWGRSVSIIFNKGVSKSLDKQSNLISFLWNSLSHQCLPQV